MLGKIWKEGTESRLCPGRQLWYFWRGEKGGREVSQADGNKPAKNNEELDLGQWWLGDGGEEGQSEELGARGLWLKGQGHSHGMV